MNVPDSAELSGTIGKQIELTERIFRALDEALEKDVPRLGRTGNADLLRKMTIRLESVRIPAVSDGNYGSLLELQKFRRHPVAIADLRAFQDFLRSI